MRSSYQLNRLMLVVGMLLFAATIRAQYVPIERNNGLQDFLDELNNLRVFDESYLVLPVSSREAFALLSRADTTNLNQRQRMQRRYFLKSLASDAPSDAPSDQQPDEQLSMRNVLNPLNRYKAFDALYVKDGITTVTLNPILGGTYYSNENGAFWQRRVGVDFKAYIGNWSIYSNIRDVYESRPLVSDSMLMPKEGALYKYNSDGSAEFSEARGGISYGGDWGYVGLFRDHIRWGYGYSGGNVFDWNAPPFTQIKLHLSPVEWLKFDYFHGSLQSDVVDSSSISRLNGVNTFGYHNKYIAANLLSFRPVKSIWLSIGNSIVYSSQNPEWTYFIPLLFYKSADHYLNGRNNRAGGNAQVFSSISYRPGYGLHFYSTLFIDELSFRRALDPSLHSNWYSFKGGIKVSNLFSNISLGAEYYRCNPMVYKHFISTTTFENARYNLGYYLRDNAQEWLGYLEFKPKHWISTSLSYQYAEKGPDYLYDISVINPTTDQQFVLGLPFIKSETWIQSSYRVQVNIIPTPHLVMTASYLRTNRPRQSAAYQPNYLKGNTNTFSLGVNYGF